MVFSVTHRFACFSGCSRRDDYMTSCWPLLPLTFNLYLHAFAAYLTFYRASSSSAYPSFCVPYRRRSRREVSIPYWSILISFYSFHLLSHYASLLQVMCELWWRWVTPSLLASQCVLVPKTGIWRYFWWTFGGCDDIVEVIISTSMEIWGFGGLTVWTHVIMINLPRCYICISHQPLMDCEVCPYARVSKMECLLLNLS